MTCLYYLDIACCITLFTYLDDFINYRLLVVFGGAITRQAEFLLPRITYKLCSVRPFLPVLFCIYKMYMRQTPPYS
jgi:hypothetical protein